MNKALLDQLLAEDEAAIEGFAESDNCVVVDWRDGLPEILRAVASFVPGEYLRVERHGVAGHLVQAGTREPQVLEFPPQTKQEDILLSVNRVLWPDFELRQYTPADGDSYSLFLAPLELWKSIELSHPRETAKYFLSLERLAAYWKKSYFARMFSKP